jgi:MFS family permease
MKKLHYGWWIVLACCAITCCNGIIMQATVNFYGPVATELGVGIGKLTIYVTIMSLTMALLYPVVGNFLEKHLKPILLFGGVIQYVALALMGTFHSVYQFWFAGLLLGIGSSITMVMAVPILINMWFVEKRGLALGLAFSFNGIAAAVFSMVAGYGITLWGWRTAYFVLAICGLITYIPAILLLIKTPQQKGVQPYGAVAISESVGEISSTNNGMTLSQALKHPAFYCMLLCAAVLAAASSEATQVSAFSTGHFGLSVEAAAGIVAIYSIGNMIGNVIMGTIDDKIGHGKTLILAIGSTIAVQAILLTITKGSALLTPAVFVLGFVLTIYSVLLPGMASEIFGEKDYSRIWAYIMSAGSICGAIIIPTYGTIFDKTGSYSGVFVLVAVLSIICVISGIAALKLAKKQN